MSTLFTAYRWLTFSLLIACNAIICSVAAWNMSFFDVRGSSVAIDTYMIFISAFSLVVMFPVIFVDISRRNAVSSRVWFELAWIALFWVLHFSGAIATSSVLPPQLCAPRLVQRQSLPCVSAKVLLSFAWICTITLFLYGLILSVLAWMHRSRNAHVWSANVGEFPWFSTRETLSSTPGTPVMAHYHMKPPSIIAPKPRRPPPIFVQQRGGVSSKYEIEDYPSGRRDNVVLPPPMLPPVQDMRPAMSLYPRYVVSNMPSTMPSTMPNDAINLGPSPPPLGDWPRPMSSNGRSTHRSHSKPQSKKPTTSQSHRVVAATAAIVPDLPHSQSTHRSRPSGSRPSGPRTKGNSSLSSKPRPPPLDLSPERMRGVRAVR